MSVTVKGRITVSLKERDVLRLNEVTTATGMSPNDAIRHALATEAFVVRALADGSKLLVEAKDGSVKQVELVY